MIGCWVKFRGVDCGSGRVWDFIWKKWKSTPSWVGLDEVGLNSDIGGSHMICNIECRRVLRTGCQFWLVMSDVQNTLEKSQKFICNSSVFHMKFVWLKIRLMVRKKGIIWIDEKRHTTGRVFGSIWCYREITYATFYGGSIKIRCCEPGISRWQVVNGVEHKPKNKLNSVKKTGW
jgi:hypothetical protein